jgi:hypothetical protein
MRTASFFAICGLLVLCLIGLNGCDRNRDVPAAGESTGVRPHGHSHGHGPHGGHIVELDTHEYHAELTQDDASHRVGVYLLDANAEAAAAVPIETASVTIAVSVDDKPTEYTLPAVTQPDDVAGKSSYFELESEPLLAILSAPQAATTPPELKVTVDGKTYTGVIDDPHRRIANAHSHSHGDDDALVWRQEVSEAGYDIAMGHHGVSLLAGSEVEPAVQVSRGGEPVADAQVFNSLLDGDGHTVLVKEVATVYEPPTEDEPAHYAQGALMIPPGTREATIRYRVVLPQGKGERTFDVPVDVK